jgi:hypothetical protein
MSEKQDPGLAERLIDRARKNSLEYMKSAIQVRDQNTLTNQLRVQKTFNKSNPGPAFFTSRGLGPSKKTAI